MDIKQLKAFLKERFPLCMKSRSFPVLTVPSIPEKQLARMTRNLSVKEDIISMCDTSLFGKGKNGIAFTDKAVYFKDLFGGVKVIYYDEDWIIGKDDAFDTLGITPTNTFFDNFALTDLIDDLVRMSAESRDSTEEPAPEAAAEAPAESPKTEAEKAPEPDEEDDDDDDEDDDDDDGGSLLLDILDVALDVTEDPSV
ncbi:hypothetical protein SAMN02910317_00910 [Ruminococcaceae bacterium FB2012]|nr:hypothetical protein SAMN02910317_00910 [Ruminococcaceae bacterium FB2012]